MCQSIEEMGVRARVRVGWLSGSGQSAEGSGALGL